MSQTPDTLRLSPLAEPPRGRMSGNALGVGAILLWAAGFPAAEVLLETWPTLPLLVLRTVIAVAFLVIFWMGMEGPRAVFRAPWGRGMALGSVAFGLGTWLLLAGQAVTDAVTVAIFAATIPITATLVEMVLDNRRLTRSFAFGVLASVAGGLVATGGTQLGEMGLGAAMILMAGLLFSWGSRAALRALPDQSHIGRTTMTLAGGLVMVTAILIASVLLGHYQPPTAPMDGKNLIMLGIYAIGAMAMSQTLWLATVKRLGIALASFHMNAAPFYVMLIMLTMGAPWSWPQAIGAGIVALGVIIAQRG